MKQIVDKLNKIAKKIDESVEIPQTDLIIDSLDAITKAYGGTPNDSNLIVDKLEDIYNNIEPAVSGNIEITENGENINVAPYATATVNVSGGGSDFKYCEVTIVCSAEGGVSGFTPANAEGVLYGNSTFHVNNGDKIKCYYTLDEGDIMALLSPVNETAVFEVSDYVNCEPIEEGSPYVLITDTTENSSFTLTVTNWGGGI